MVLFQGNKRLLNDLFEEDSATTSSNRVLNIYGISSYDDMTNTIITVKAIELGEANATIKINNLAEKPIKMFVDGSLDVTYDNWIDTNQVYLLTYNKTDDSFIAFPIASLGSAPSPTIDVPVLSIPDNILNLTSSSTEEEILAAFGDTDAMSRFASAIESYYVLNFIGNYGESEFSTKDRLAIETYKDLSDAANTKYSFTILTSNNSLKKYIFNMPSETQIINSVEVIETTLADTTYVDNKFVVDSAMSNTSENPVQNKVIKAALDAINTKLANIDSLSERVTTLEGNIPNITSGTSNPTGGADGDIYFQYSNS